jgi:glycosyltransferase involved in cell wall biosynthesis
MPKKLAILCDFAEENWPSMDLVAQMLFAQLRAEHLDQLDPTMLQPTFKRRLSKLGIPAIADRIINRMFHYPRWMKKRTHQFDLFHLADHSYSQLVHVLPADRTGVFCHDLDTFRCLLDPEAEPRPAWFRAMARRILEGMQKARVVFHSSNAVREQILRHGLIDPARLVHAPLGIAPEFRPENEGTTSPLPAVGDFILHVGSCIPRKRIDVLLDVFARLSRRHPELRLVQVGGEWNAEQTRQIERLGISSRVNQLPRQEGSTIADLYRRARAVLVTSEAEGFGLPVVEALACGAVVVGSDIPVLREVGGEGVMYCAVGDVDAWTQRLEAFFSGTEVPPPLEVRLLQSHRYSWKAHADCIARAYLEFGLTDVSSRFVDRSLITE